jgi:hypothetical protein
MMVVVEPLLDFLPVLFRNNAVMGCGVGLTSVGDFPDVDGIAE